jgi:hypothetical protein
MGISWYTSCPLKFWDFSINMGFPDQIGHVGNSWLGAIPKKLGLVRNNFDKTMG